MAFRSQGGLLAPTCGGKETEVGAFVFNLRQERDATIFARQTTFRRYGHRAPSLIVKFIENDATREDLWRAASSSSLDDLSVEVFAMRTVFGAAMPCRRAARFGVSPTTRVPEPPLSRQDRKCGGA
jgi:hypothetical protein